MSETSIEYAIKNEDNLRKRCEKAIKVVPNYGDSMNNEFSIKKEELIETITRWQKNYKGLRNELENWKQESNLPYEAVALICERKKVECVFLKIYNSEKHGILNCICISRTYKKPSIITKLLNEIFKHNSQKIYKQLAKSQPGILAAFIIFRGNVMWK